MASICLFLPDPFDFKRPDEWERWKRHFEQFRVASGLSEECDARQVSTLLYCIGEAGGCTCVYACHGRRTEEVQRCGWEIGWILQSFEKCDFRTGQIQPP